LRAKGFKIVQQGLIGRHRFVYFDTQGDHPSTAMELYDISGGPDAYFEQIRATALAWDGSDPIRRCSKSDQIPAVRLATGFRACSRRRPPVRGERSFPVRCG
jgi:hypothetical protein